MQTIHCQAHEVVLLVIWVPRLVGSYFLEARRGEDVNNLKM